MKVERVVHEFVEHIPEQLADGVIYASIPFRTVVHRCCCGCGLEVVTPLSPTKWTLIFDGQTISLTPSIGNWSFPCQSHYWIGGNRVEWARRWSPRQIKAARRAEMRGPGLPHLDSASTGAATTSSKQSRGKRKVDPG